MTVSGCISDCNVFHSTSPTHELRWPAHPNMDTSSTFFFIGPFGLVIYCLHLLLCDFKLWETAACRARRSSAERWIGARCRWSLQTRRNPARFQVRASGPLTGCTDMPPVAPFTCCHERLRSPSPEETLNFWKGIADVGLLGEVVPNISSELLELLNSVKQRNEATALQETGTAQSRSMIRVSMQRLMRFIIQRVKTFFFSCGRCYISSQ